MSSSVSSSFESEDDLTSYLSSTKINFDPSIFEHHLSSVISDLESFHSSDLEDSIHEYKLKESNLNVEFDHFGIPRTEHAMFSDDLTNSSFLKDNIEISSSKIGAKLNEILTSFDKDSTHSSSLRSEQIFLACE